MSVRVEATNHGVSLPQIQNCWMTSGNYYGSSCWRGQIKDYVHAIKFRVEQSDALVWTFLYCVPHLQEFPSRHSMKNFNASLCHVSFYFPAMILTFSLFTDALNRHENRSGVKKVRRIRSLLGSPWEKEENFVYFIFKSINLREKSSRITRRYERIIKYISIHGHIMLYKKWDWQLLSRRATAQL